MIVSTSGGQSPFNGFVAGERRAYSWGLGPIDTFKIRMRNAWHLHRIRDDVLMISVASEAIYLALFSLLSRRWLCVYDFMLPKSRILRILGRLVLWRVNCWAVVRRGDTDMLARRFGVRRSKCTFVPFPATSPPPGFEATLGDYIYAAGHAYRDWATFTAAGEALNRRAIVCTPQPLSAAGSWLVTRPRVPPDTGRALSAGARLVVLPMQDTEMASGPTVLVDAQARGKAVIATDVNGTRDYIEHGVTGWLVPPGDPDALAEQIRAVIDDDETLLKVGEAARQATLDVQAVLSVLRGLMAFS